MIYEYVCDSCRVKFNVHKPASEYNRDEACPRCKVGARRVVSPVGTIFKTDGFPGNDMKADAKGATKVGRKPTHAEYEQIEAQYPDAFKEPPKDVIEEANHVARKD